MLGDRLHRHGLAIAPAIGESNRARRAVAERPAAGRVEELIFGVNELRGARVREADGVLRSAVRRQGEFERTVGGERIIANGQGRRPKVCR